MTARTNSDVFGEFHTLQREVRELQEKFSADEPLSWENVSDLVTKAFEKSQEMETWFLIAPWMAPQCDALSRDVKKLVMEVLDKILLEDYNTHHRAT